MHERVACSPSLITSFLGRYGQHGLNITVGGKPCYFHSFSYATPIGDSSPTNLTCVTPRFYVVGDQPLFVAVGGQTTNVSRINVFKFTALNVSYISVHGGRAARITGNSISPANGVVPEVAIVRDEERCSPLNRTVTTVNSSFQLSSVTIINQWACTSWPYITHAASGVVVDSTVDFTFGESSAFQSEAVAQANITIGTARYALSIKIGSLWMTYQLTVLAVEVPTISTLSLASGPLEGNTSLQVEGEFFPSGEIAVQFGNVIADPAVTSSKMVDWENLGYSCSGSSIINTTKSSLVECQTYCQNSWGCEILIYDNATGTCNSTSEDLCNVDIDSNFIAYRKVSGFRDLCPHPYLDVEKASWVCSQLVHSFLMDSSPSFTDQTTGIVAETLGGALLTSYGWIDMNVKTAYLRFNLSSTMQYFRTQFSFELWADLGTAQVSTNQTLMYFVLGNGAKKFEIMFTNEDFGGFQVYIKDDTQACFRFYQNGIMLGGGPHHFVWHGSSFSVDGSYLISRDSSFNPDFNREVIHSIILTSAAPIIHAFRVYYSTLTQKLVKIHYARGRGWDPFNEHSANRNTLYSTTSCEYLSDTKLSCKSPPQSNETVPASGMALRVSVAIDNDRNYHFSTSDLRFLYYRTPIISKFFPNLGPVEGAGIVNVEATNIIRTFHVYGSSNSTNLAKCKWYVIGINPIYTFGRFSSSNSGNLMLQCVQPKVGVTGRGELQIALNGQDFTSSEVVYTYYKQPNLTRSTLPGYGPMHGNTTIHIFGEG
eukprot:979691-Amorphochlora_amoeboformis.AAC.1